MSLRFSFLLVDSQSEKNKLSALLERYPNLIKHSCSVTIQQPLSTSGYQQLTLEWIKEEDIEVRLGTEISLKTSAS